MKHPGVPGGAASAPRSVLGQEGGLGGRGTPASEEEGVPSPGKQGVWGTPRRKQKPGDLPQNKEVWGTPPEENCDILTHFPLPAGIPRTF